MRAAKIAMLSVLAAGIVGMSTSLHDAINRSRQKRTMMAMKAWADAFESHRKLPPARDAWGRALQIAGVHDSYSIRSLGRDGLRDARPIRGEADDFDCDIVYSNGSFV